MGRVSMKLRAMAYAFLWLYLTEGSQATRKEDLERAAELAVERAAERAAERAVEKALESGNSTTESETIRESYSSVRKYDKSLKLPGTGYTPAQRREYDRIMRERDAAERASALVKRSVDNERVDYRGDSVTANVEPTVQFRRQYEKDENLPGTDSHSFWLFHFTREPPFPVESLKSNDPSNGADDYQQDNRDRLPSLSADRVHGGQYPSFFNRVKVTRIQGRNPYQQSFHVIPIMATATAPSVTFPYSVERRGAWFTNMGDYSSGREDGHRSEGA